MRSIEGIYALYSYSCLVRAQMRLGQGNQFFSETDAQEVAWHTHTHTRYTTQLLYQLLERNKKALTIEAQERWKFERRVLCNVCFILGSLRRSEKCSQLFIETPNEALSDYYIYLYLNERRINIISPLSNIAFIRFSLRKANRCLVSNDVLTEFNNRTGCVVIGLYLNLWHSQNGELKKERKSVKNCIFL